MSGDSKRKKTITRPHLASFEASLTPDGWPSLRLDYVTEGGDILFGPHHQLALRLDPLSAAKLAGELQRLATESKAILAARLEAAKRR
ncbi:hypothetical protein [Mesorhizobium sp. CAU 1741]|uniref:hypothetical protein n=1 Tax=Mesorhizobium sp. CAU 1741 TaxID=3140366 RepID=UPI00325B4754